MITENTLRFLMENKLNNSKEYFVTNKKEYENFVLNPLIELVEDLTLVMKEIDTEINCEPKISKTISRIYRDTRFSKDKSIFREAMWIVFMRKKQLFEGQAGFFFEITPNFFRYGCGYYKSGNEAMKIMRDLIDSKNSKFLKAFETIKNQNIFQIEGELFKRTKTNETNKEFIDWYDRKSICLVQNSQNFSLLYSYDVLVEKLIKDFRALRDVYYFFKEIEKYKKT